MSATGYLDSCGFNPASSGTGDFVVSAAITGYQTPAGASAVNGTVYSYRAQSSDLSQWENGFGAYTVSTTTLARTTVTASSTGSKVSFTAAPNVYITALSTDLANASLLTNGTVPAARLPSGAAFIVNPSNPSGTTNTGIGTGVMMGLGTSCNVTPLTTGRLTVTLSGNMVVSSSGNRPSSRLRYGTGTAPSNGVAATGTAVASNLSGNVNLNGGQLPFTHVAIIAGLTVGTTYWFDSALSTSGGTASLTDLTFTASEF